MLDVVPTSKDILRHVLLLLTYGSDHDPYVEEYAAV